MEGLTFLLVLLLIAVAVIVWVLSRKTYIVVRTSGAAVLSSATAGSERAEAEAMYSAITAETIKARRRPRLGDGPDLRHSSPSLPAAHPSSPSIPTVQRVVAPPPHR